MLKEEDKGGGQQQQLPSPIGHVFFSGLNEPCAVDSVVEIVVILKINIFKNISLNKIKR